MANICDCGVAIAKEDLKKLDGAITRTKKGEGSTYKTSYDIVKGGERRKVVHYEHYEFGGVGKSKSESYFLVDNKKITPAEYRETYNELGTEWREDWDTHKVLIDTYCVEGWKIDWLKLHTFSYEATPYVAEYDDHITIYFGGRWSFPEKLEELLNKKEVRWQGAEAECGCEVLNDELGNEDFGLKACIDKDDEGYDNYFVEDRS